MKLMFHSLGGSEGSEAPEIYYLLAGQSNALGNPQSGSPPPQVTPTPPLDTAINGAIMWDGSNYVTLDYSDLTLYPDRNRWATELSFGANYADENTNVLTIEKVALSSTAVKLLAEIDWNVSSVGEMFDDAKAALQRLKAKSISDGAKNPKFVWCWLQGNRDARTDVGGGSTYQQNLQDINDQLEQIQPFDLRIIVKTQSFLDPVDYDNTALVRSAQDSFIAANPNTIKFDEDDYIIDFGVDLIHFNGEGLEKLGADFYSKVKEFFNL